nr:MAG TPA: hypothetical protein [Caudoviricetes sp.]
MQNNFKYKCILKCKIVFVFGCKYITSYII